jgi:hypothetical protein
MARVDVNIEEADDIEDEEDGHIGSGVRATCSRCGHKTESFGTGPKSRMRCIMLMKEECPEEERNFYVDTEA